MKILGGVVTPDQGTIEIDGAAHASLTVSESLSSGIAFVHQELNLFDNLDVGANVLIGREPLVGRPPEARRPQGDEAHRGAVAASDSDVDFDVDDLVSDLSLAQRQLLEIAKALSLNARVVIMDEPTSSLTSTETDRLMRVIGELKADGVSIIFITHRLNEVETCADRVVVLRDGSVVGELARDQIHRDAMIRLMIGRDLKSLYIPPKSPPGANVLEVAGLRTLSRPAHRREPFAEGRRDLGHGRIDRRGANRARARRVRRRPGARRRDSARTARLSPFVRPKMRSRTEFISCRRTASAAVSCLRIR